jgi:hypothetical protein
VVEGLSPNQTVPIVNLLKAKISEGKVAVPVKQSLSIYANFKHVSGVPTTQKGHGFSLSKLRVLNTLIERLISLKGKSFKAKDTTTLSPDAVNSLIQKYTKELHTEIMKASVTSYGTASGAGAGMNGMVMSLFA